MRYPAPDETNQQVLPDKEDIYTLPYPRRSFMKKVKKYLSWKKVSPFSTWSCFRSLREISIKADSNITNESFEIMDTREATSPEDQRIQGILSYFDDNIDKSKASDFLQFACIPWHTNIEFLWTNCLSRQNHAKHKYRRPIGVLLVSIWREHC